MHKLCVCIIVRYLMYAVLSCKKLSEKLNIFYLQSMKIGQYREYYESKVGRVSDVSWYQLKKFLTLYNNLSFDGIDDYLKRVKNIPVIFSCEIDSTIDYQWINRAPQSIKVRDFLSTMNVVLKVELAQKPSRHVFYSWFKKHGLKGCAYITYSKQDLLPVVKQVLKSKFVK
jgi:hypothetical protein